MEVILNSEQDKKISEALERGRKIEAVKLCREFSGCGLKEAKNYVDGKISEMVERDPGRYAKLASSGPGCLSVFLIVPFLYVLIIFFT